MQLTNEIAARYVGGQIEVQNAGEGYLYRGEIASIAVEGDDDDATLKVTLRWMVKADGFPPFPERWVHADNRSYHASLQIYSVSDIGDQRLCLSSFVVGETAVLYPPGGSTFDPSVAVERS